MSEPLTEAVLRAVEEHAARLHDGQHIQNDVTALVAEIRRLRAENADLRAALDCGDAGGECALDAPGGDECRKHALAGMLSALSKAEREYCAVLAHRVRADRYAAVLAHVESLGQHADGCRSPSGRGLRAADPWEWRCVPECPTATAKKAREGT